MSETSGLEAANLRLAKAGGDVCRALGVYAESREAAVVNELVRATQHQAAEQQRRIADGWATDGYAAEADALRQGADAIDPETKP